MIGHLRSLIEQARNSCDNPPLVGLVGFGTWAQIVAAVPRNEIADRRRHDGLSDYLLLDQTRIMRDPYCADDVILFVQADGKTADVRVFAGLGSMKPEIVVR